MCILLLHRMRSVKWFAQKQSGKFTVENQKEAFQKSFDTAVSIMTQETKDFIENAYGSLTEWLTAQIEAQVKSNKSEKIDDTS